MINSVEALKKIVWAKEGAASGAWLNRFRKLRENQKSAQRFYDMEYEIKIAESFKDVVIKLPTARQMIDTYLGHLPLSNPIVEVIPFKQTETYRERAINQQDYYQALLQHSLTQADPAIPYAAKDMGIRGEAFFKVLYDIGALEGLPERERNETDKDYKERKQAHLIERMPIRLIAPDPMNCYPSADHIDCRPVEMIEVYNIYAGYLRLIFPDWKSSKKDTDIVVVVEYWRDDKRCFLADGKPLTDGFEDNPYGITPYVHAYSGWGHRTVDNKPEDKAVNMIFEAMELIKQQCRFQAYLDKAVAFAATPIIHTSKPKTDYEGAGGLKVFPGMVLYEEERVDVSWAAANLPAGILQAIALNDSRINRVQAGVLRGELPRGVEAGYPMALMIGEARLQFGIPLENLKTLTARALELVRHIVRQVVEEDLPLWGADKAVILRPQDCEGAYRIKVEFDATTPEGRASRALAGQRLRQGGSISLWTELKEWQGNKNPEKEINRILSESLMKHPALQRLVAVKAVRAIEGEAAALEIQTAMEEAEAGAVRHAASTGIPVGGELERELPEDVLARALTKRARAVRAEPTEE